VRQRVVALAADRLGTLAPDEVPQALRPFARFTAARRARLAAAPIAAALETDDGFRDQVAEAVRGALPDLAGALERGIAPAAADPRDVAAAAYVLRPDGWVDLVRIAVTSLQVDAATLERSAAAAAAERLRGQLAAERGRARTETHRLREELTLVRDELARVRRQLREAGERVKRAETAARAAERAADAARSEAAASGAAAEAELRRLRGRVADAEAALETARRTAREGRAIDDVRLRVLLDTVLDAAAGLRRELALPPLTERPADLIAAGLEPGEMPDVQARGLAADDPVLLDQLLGIPQVHLVVDGYNVTKEGYGGLPLEAQRQRLLAGLGGLAAQTRAEITCVFDGAERATPLAVPAPRGVRLLFSAPGELADDVIRRLVAAEPPGRAIVVVSSDREIADGVRACGARAVPAALLLRRLDRS
jgi:predicted RNA-binding protein with PIN domain